MPAIFVKAMFSIREPSDQCDREGCFTTQAVAVPLEDLIVFVRAGAQVQLVNHLAWVAALQHSGLMAEDDINVVQSGAMTFYAKFRGRAIFTLVLLSLDMEASE